jgi:peroxiredoxin
MGRLRLIALAAAITCCGSLSLAAEAGAPIGKSIADFSLPDYRGKVYSLADYKDKLVVVAFIGTECPLAKTYAPRLRDLAAEFEKQGVAFVAIDANQQDTLSEIGAFARSHEITFPVLKDNNNEIADRFGAVRTPEVFLLDKAHVVRYWGRIDDQYGFKTGAGYVKPQLHSRDLADAVTQVLAGKEVVNPIVKADGCFIGRVAKTKPHGEITYSNQVARIMQARCVECHRSGEVAPFTLTSYDEVVGWAETIKEVVQEGRMPPWFADPRYGHFTNDSRLSDEEKQTLASWVENGCPQGNAADLPEPRKFVEGWRIGEPDQIVYMSDKSYTVPEQGTIEYQFFTVDPGWTTDKWIQATEARPGNRAVVHHIIVMVQPKDGTDFGGRGGIGGYAPGMTPAINPPGTATFVPAGSKLIFQMHYTTNGTQQDDRSMVGICFADAKKVKQMVRGGLVGDTGFKIPPGDPNFEVKAKHLFLKDTVLLNLTPHMHLRGKDFKYEAEYPDGTREVLLDVPNYDFNWQIRYMYKEPKLMPKGTRLHCTAHFDNSPDNPANPDPTKLVTFGDQTWEEMMFGFYTSMDPKQDLTAGGLAKSGDEGGEVNGFAGEGSVTKATATKN